MVFHSRATGGQIYRHIPDYSPLGYVLYFLLFVPVALLHAARRGGGVGRVIANAVYRVTPGLTSWRFTQRLGFRPSSHWAVFGNSYDTNTPRFEITLRRISMIHDINLAS